MYLIPKKDHISKIFYFNKIPKVELECKFRIFHHGSVVFDHRYKGKAECSFSMSSENYASVRCSFFCSLCAMNSTHDWRIANFWSKLITQCT